MPNPTLMLAPMNYKGKGLVPKYEYGLSLSGFPMGSWTSDTYTAWLAQNGSAVGLTMLGSTIAVVGGMATGNVMAAVGGVIGVASQMAQLNKASIQPDQAKGQLNNGSLHMAMGTLDFYYSHMTIKAEFAKRIDNFLSMYGYKVSTLKVPEVRSRTQWNYIQTIDVNITGAIPHDDMVKLKEMYNNGVTFWHNVSNFLNYGVANSIR